MKTRKVFILKKYYCSCSDYSPQIEASVIPTKPVEVTEEEFLILQRGIHLLNSKENNGYIYIIIEDIPDKEEVIAHTMEAYLKLSKDREEDEKKRKGLLEKKKIEGEKIFLEEKRDEFVVRYIVCGKEYELGELKS